MSKVQLNHSVVGYFLTLSPEANHQEFEQSLLKLISSEQISRESGGAIFTVSKALNAERGYLFTALIGDNSGGVDRQSKPLVLRAVLDVISEIQKTFPVKITQAFWSPARTPEALIDEFNKLPGMMGKFSVAAAGA